MRLAWSSWIFIMAIVAIVTACEDDNKDKDKEKTRMSDTQQSDWTVEEIEALKSEIKSQVFLGEGNEENAPGALRLSFHDCVGGCDGCVNLQNPANYGLENIVARLDQFWQDNLPNSAGKTMSRADLFTLSGIAAVEYSIKKNNDECPDVGCEMSEIIIDFMTGRQDCPTSPSTTDDEGLPSGFFDYPRLMDFWSTNFGFTKEEVTAIMGAHTLGGFEKQNSGYTGDWKEGAELYFNNDYYKLLLNPNLNWEHFDASLLPDENGDHPKNVRAPGEKWMWRGFDDQGEDKSFMINADVDLVFEPDIIDEGGQSRCSFFECPASQTREQAVLYAAEPDTWLADFACAFQKMTSNGVKTLKTLSGTPRKPEGKQVACEGKHL